MRIDVVGRNLEMTDAISNHAEEKAQKLLRYFDGVQQITFTIERVDHSSGHPVFEVELIVDVKHHDDFVAHATGDDLYLTVDQAVQKGSRQLSDFKEKLKLNKR